MTRIALVGSRDLAQQLAGYMVQTAGLEVSGFFDDYRAAGESTVHGPILGPLSDVQSLHQQGRFDSVALGVGYRHLEKRSVILGTLRGSVPLFTFIHPTAWVDPTARIGEGASIFPGCRVDANVVIGAGSLLNVGCVVCHDSFVDENCFLGPAVTVAGFTRIGRECFLGVGTVVIDNITVGPGVQTGGGAVVTDDLKEPGLYLGVPARLRRA